MGTLLLRGCSSVWPSHTCAFPVRCGHQLKLPHNRDIDDRTLLNVLEATPKLRWLSLIGLSRITEYTMGALARFCPDLTSLTLARRFSYTGSGFRANNDGGARNVERKPTAS